MPRDNILKLLLILTAIFTVLAGLYLLVQKPVKLMISGVMCGLAIAILSLMGCEGLRKSKRRSL